jgi:hypothetical protein
MSIAINEVVYYRNNSGIRVIAKVKKVNRVNSKVKVLAIGNRVVFSSKSVDVYKGYLRRATPDMIEFVFDIHLDPTMY